VLRCGTRTRQSADTPVYIKDIRIGAEGYFEPAPGTCNGCSAGYDQYWFGTTVSCLARSALRRDSGGGQPSLPTEEISMNLKPHALLFAGAAFLAAPAIADDSLARFDGGIGSQPVGRINADGTAAVNTVGGVPAGGAPWVIRELKATIRADGRIAAAGAGLLLGGGNNIGTRGGPRQVLASLFCRDTTGTLIGPFNSGAVDLDPNGDFRIRSVLADATGATPPNPCGDAIDNRPVLLIRTVAAGAPAAWFAAGILRD
jgi:hypothetical protein